MPFQAITAHTIWPCEAAPHSSRTRTIAALVFVAAALACLCIDWRLRVLAADDSYIHLRIAERLMHTGRAYFNTNERVMVTSSPLWTLLLGLSGLCCRWFPAALPLEALSIGSACAITFLLASAFSACQDLSRPLRAAYTAIVPCVAFFLLLQSSIFQMETPLAVMLLLGSLYLWHRGSPWWLSVLVLAGFVRYEYLFLGAVLFAFAVLTKRISLRSIVFAAATLAAGVLWIEYQFGTIVPNTVKAKAVAYVISASQTFHTLGLGVVRCLVLLVIFVVIAMSRTRRQVNVPNVLFVGGLMLDALYISRKTFIFPWYTPLTLAPVVLGLLLGAALVGRGTSRIFIVVAAVCLSPLRLFPHEIIAAATGKPWTDRVDAFNIRAREYVVVGKAIHSVCPEAQLMTSEIGGLGEGFPGEILDSFGLATPAATKYHPMRVPQDRRDGGLGATPPRFVLEAKPDVIVAYDMFSEALRRDYDRSAYDVYVYPPLPLLEGPQFDMWSLNKLYVFVAKQGACSASAVDAAIRRETATE